MNKSHLLPLFSALSLGLMLTGCNRTESTKIAANDTPDVTPPTSYDNKTATGNKTSTDSTDRSQVATASTAAPTADKAALAENSKQPADTSAIAAPSTPTAPTTPAPTADKAAVADISKQPADTSPMVAASTPTVSTAAAPMTDDSAVVAANPKPDASAAADMSSLSEQNTLASTDRRAEWKLTSDDITNELTSSGRVVRSRIAGANEPTGLMDSVLVSQINGKLQSDADTSALKIAVEAEKGVVTLNGSAHSPDQIGKAVALSLETGGVTQVVSLIKLDTTP